jgi:hypothetical protein
MYPLEPGTTMNDGTVYAGISPETGNMMFVTPKDSYLTATFNEAVARADTLNRGEAFGHNDWRLPTLKELDVIFENKDKGALKGTFNLEGVNYQDLKVYGKDLHPNADGWYRTTHWGSNVTRWCQLFKTGDKAAVFDAGFASVRFMRDGEPPELPPPPPYKTSAVTDARQEHLKEHGRRRKLRIKPA